MAQTVKHLLSSNPQGLCFKKKKLGTMHTCELVEGKQGLSQVALWKLASRLAEF